MDAFFGTMHRLHTRGPTCRGLAVDAEGVTLGPDCVLVDRTPAGYRCADAKEVAWLLRSTFNHDNAADRLAARLASIAKALDAGELAKAQILGLHLAIGELDDLHLERLARATSLRKAGYNPDQLRDDHGRWTREGNASRVAITGAIAAADAGASVFGAVRGATLAGLAELGANLNAATAFLGVLFIPTNRSLISEGALPDRPDLAYRYDEDMGVLSVYRAGESADSPLLSGHTGPDGVIRDSNGHPLGRDLGTSVIVDPDALPDIVASAQIGQQAGTGAQARSDADTNEPKLCPDPGPDKPGGKSDRAIAYQAYINSVVNPGDPLPQGLAVRLVNPITGKDVVFDDCYRRTGIMVEAKGEGYLEMLQKDSVMPWKGAEIKMLRQAKSQVQAADGRPIEWHFAEKEVADYMRKKFADNGLDIIVTYSPPPWKMQ